MSEPRKSRLPKELEAQSQCNPVPHGGRWHFRGVSHPREDEANSAQAKWWSEVEDSHPETDKALARNSNPPAAK